MFKLAIPLALLLLPLPILIWFFVKKASFQATTALKLPFLTAIAPLIQNKQGLVYSKKSLVLFALVWLLAVIAAANPIWIGPPTPYQREGRNIMMVLDLSGSMEVQDMMQNDEPVTRLTVVKKAAKQFVNERKGDKIGLILFGSLAYLQTPLTYDHQNVLTRIDDATSGLAGNTTSIGDALVLAIKNVERVPKNSRLIISLTDGASNSGVLTPLKAAEIAKNEDIKVYTIGLSADSSSQTPSHFYNDFRAGADLDEETLEKIAHETGGRYFRATDATSLASVYSTINQLETDNQENTIVRPQKNYYPWPLGAALLILFTYFFNLVRQGRAKLV